MKLFNIVLIVVLIYSTPAESTESKNEWYPNVNKEFNTETNKGYNNVYLPPVEQHIPPPPNNIYPTYPSYNTHPVAPAPHQQYYYPNFVVPQTVPASNYLPIAPQNSNYNYQYLPQTEQIVTKPTTMLSLPFDMGMKGLGFMSKVLNNVHQGIDSFTGYLPQENGYISGYQAQKNIPLTYGNGNRYWQQEYNSPAYSYGGYDSNLGQNYNLYYPEKGNHYGYNNPNGNGYPAWNAPNNMGVHGHYYYVQ